MYRGARRDGNKVKTRLPGGVFGNTATGAGEEREAMYRSRMGEECEASVQEYGVEMQQKTDGPLGISPRFNGLG